MRTRAVLVALLLLAPLGSAGAAEVVVYSAHGKDILGEFAESFESARPDVRVRWLDMGAAEVLERIRAERASPQAQVWWGAPAPLFILAAREGLLEPYRPTWADAVGEYARGEGDLWFGQFDLPIGIGYVPGRVPEADLPRRWDDLLREDAPWRLVIRDPPASGTMKTFLAAMILRQDSVEAGFAWLRRLHARTREYAANPTLLYEMLGRGEGDVTVWNVTDLLFQRSRHGRPFEVILPVDGVPVITDSIALVRGAGEAARAFYEHVTSVEASLRLAEEHFRIPARRDLPADRMPAWREGLAYTPLELDRDRLVREIEGWTARWEREVRGTGGRWAWFVLGVAAAGLAVAIPAVLVARRRRRALEDV